MTKKVIDFDYLKISKELLTNKYLNRIDFNFSR